MNDVWGENWRLEPELELEIMILLEVDKKMTKLNAIYPSPKIQICVI